MLDEYESVKDRAAPVPAQARVDRNEQLLQAATLAAEPAEKEARSVTAKLIDTMPASRPQGYVLRNTHTNMHSVPSILHIHTVLGTAMHW